jgi:hypothetical protein
MRRFVRVCPHDRFPTATTHPIPIAGGAPEATVQPEKKTEESDYTRCPLRAQH